MVAQSSRLQKSPEVVKDHHPVKPQVQIESPEQTPVAIVPQATRAGADTETDANLGSQPSSSRATQRALSDPRLLTPANLLALQHTAGNGTVGHLIQRKLMVGTAHDAYEQEADRVAERVVSQQSRIDSGQGEEQEDQTEPILERQGEEEGVQAKDVQAAYSFEADGEFERQLSATRGGGSPLPDNLRGQMEASMGADFSGVRIHADANAAQLNRVVSAQAFTLGQDIYLGEGKSNLESTEGQALLAHELTHTIQQTGNAAPGVKTQAGAAAVQAGHIQRLMTSEELTSLVGQPAYGKPWGDAYKGVVNSLDAYHKQSQKLWASGAHVDVFHDTLTRILNQIETYDKAYLRDKPHGKRAPVLRALIENEVPEERAFIAWLGKMPDKYFQLLDHTEPFRQVAREMGKGQVGHAAEDTGGFARITDHKLTVNDYRSGRGTGHKMLLMVTLKIPPMPVDSDPQALQVASSIYGARLEYWERIEIQYSFETTHRDEAEKKKTSQAGQELKQWNDVLVLNAHSPSLPWQDQAQDAREGKLPKGRELTFIAVDDKPTFKSSENYYGKRILRFRIVLKDATGVKQEVLATQVVESDGLKDPVYRSYDDTAGNSMVADTGGAAERPAAGHGAAAGIPGQPAGTPARATSGSVVAQAAPAVEPRSAAAGPAAPQVTPHGNTPVVLAEDVPLKAILEVPVFYSLIKGGTAEDFLYHELSYVETLQRVFGWDEELAYKKLMRLSSSGQAEIAGAHMLPQIRSGKYKCYPAGSGLLVALVDGGKVVKMYYTSNVPHTLEVKGNLPRTETERNMNVPSREHSVPVLLRTFAEVPRD